MQQGEPPGDSKNALRVLRIRCLRWGEGHQQRQGEKKQRREAVSKEEGAMVQQCLLN